MAEIILPGTYVTVRDEGLIAAGRVASGNIGIVGTATAGEANKVYIVGSFTEAKAIFGPPAPRADASNTTAADTGVATTQPTLLSSLEYIYNNGGQTVYAVRAASDSADDYGAALTKLENEIINIVLLAGQDAATTEMRDLLTAHLNVTAENKRERIGIIGSSAVDDVDAITAQTVVNDSGRVVFVAPGIQLTRTVDNVATPTRLSGAYLATAVAGLIASLPVQASPTNKVLTIPGLTVEFSFSQLENLVQNRVLAVEKRDGYRIVKGITTSTNSAWQQITTRRIVDYAIYGVRSACNPYIGKLNNARVRGAMAATLDAFLTRMVQDEALINYDLTVTATRAQEIAGETIVTMTLRPTFSIDFVLVTMYLG